MIGWGWCKAEEEEIKPGGGDPGHRRSSVGCCDDFDFYSE